MRIRNKKSFVVVGPEGQAPKTLWSRITHVLYLLFLIVLAGYLFYFIFTRFTSFQVNGQVGVERIRVGALQGGRIVALSVNAGDRVSAGDPLIVLETSERCEAISEKPLRKLRQAIILNRQRLSGLNIRRDAAMNRQKQLLDERRLGQALELERRRISGRSVLQRELDELDMDVLVLKEQIRLQEQELGQLAQESGQPQDCGMERISASVSGKVAAVNQHLYEVVSRKETILTLIPEKPDVRIEAFFKADDTLPVAVGDTLRVRLPDDRETQGQVASMHASAYPFPDREHHIYIPEETSVRVLILPANPDVAEQWSAFDRMDVLVEGKR